MLILFGIYTSDSTPTILSPKSLNIILLDNDYAKSLGLSLNSSIFVIIFATSLIVGNVTDFAVPIAIIGLAIPHLNRLIFKSSNHKILLPAVFLFGAIVILICDSITQVPTSDYTLPINAIIALVGAPVVIWLLIKQWKIMF